MRGYSIPFHSISYFECETCVKNSSRFSTWVMMWSAQKKHRMCIFSWPVLFVHNDLFETTQKYHKTICIIFILVVFIYLFFFIFWMIWFLSPLTRSRSFISFFVLFFLSQNESNRCDQQARLYWIKLLKRMLLLSNKYHALFFYDSNIFFICLMSFFRSTSSPYHSVRVCISLILSSSLLFSLLLFSCFLLRTFYNLLVFKMEVNYRWKWSIRLYDILKIKFFLN